MKESEIFPKKYTSEPNLPESMQHLRHIMIKIMNVDPVLVINQPDVDILEPLSD